MPERPGETPAERADRNFADILQETRVLQTGVQVLFAFLLTVPFQGRFTELDGVQRGYFLVALATSAAASIVLAATVAAHRALFGRGIKDEVVSYAHRALVAGLVLVGVAVVAGVTLVTDVVVGRPEGVVTAVLAGLAAAVLWYAIPLRLRLRS
jgi:4-amino-4-deoxy-L-arabinose transferase-like glycosyltransferase